MIHLVITCDKCNPQDGTRGIIKRPYPNEGWGVFEGPPSAAAGADWQVGPIDICPDCQEEGE